MEGMRREEYVSKIPDPIGRQEVYMYNILVKLDALTEYIKSNKECKCSAETKDGVREIVAVEEVEVGDELKDIKTKVSVPKEKQPRKKKVEQVI